MTIFGRVRAALGLSDEQAEKLAVLEAAEGDQEVGDDTPADQDIPDAESDAPAEISPELAARLAAAETEAAESRMLLQAEIARRHDRERVELLDSLSEDGTLVPAARALIEPVFRVLEADSADVLVLQTGEGEIKLTAIEMLAEALKLNASIQDKYLGRSEVVAAAQDGDKSGGWADHERSDALADEPAASE